MGKRALVCSTLAIALVAVVTVAAERPALSAPASGIALVGPIDLNPAPPSAKLASEYAAAFAYAQKHATEVGYPWVDRGAGRVMLPTTTAGPGAAGGALPAGVDAGTVTPTVERSMADLNRIKDDAAKLVQAGVPDADTIWQTEPDAEHDRVIITVSRLSNALLVALAQRYGTDAVAVRVAKRVPLTTLALTGQEGDTPPFFGGAHIHQDSSGECTSGFPWVHGSSQFMLTAGHCVPQGGQILTAKGTPPNVTTVQLMGSVNSGTEENFDVGSGTTPLPNETALYGDLAEVEITPDVHGVGDVGAYIYRYGPGSVRTAPVVGALTTTPNVGDSFCEESMRDGETCGWTVVDTNVNVPVVTDGLNDIDFNVDEVVRPGACPEPGSSGGPVYQVRLDGGVIAEGILSAAGGTGDGNCMMEYTDINSAMNAWPGSVVKTMVARPSSGMAVNTQGDYDRLYIRSTTSTVQEKTRNGEAASPSWSSYGTGTSPSGTTPASDPVSVVDASGTIWMFIRAANGHLYARNLTAGTWSAWTSLGGTLTGTPHAVVDQFGIVRVYVRDSSHVVNEIFKRPGQAWSGFTSFGLATSSDVTPVIDPRGKVWLFAIDSGGGVWQDSLPPSGSWSGWSLIRSGMSTATPVAVVDTKQNARLYLRDASNNVYELFLTPGASAWVFNPFGATSTASPIATVDHDGVVRVYIVGSDGRLQERFLQSGGSWSTWADLATTTITSPIGTVVDGHNVIDVFVRLPNNLLGIDELVPGFVWTGIAAQPGATLA